MTTRVSGHRYDLEIKGQGEIYLKSVLHMFCKLLFHFLMEGIPIQHSDCLWRRFPTIAMTKELKCIK